MSDAGKRVLMIAGGKTGGHLFPGLAVARRFMALRPDNKVIFVGTRSGIETRVLPREGMPLKLIISAGIRGKGALRTSMGLALLPVSFAQAAWTVFKTKPSVALGVGGYVSGPVLTAAWTLGVPTAIQEQNLVPGVTNRILGKLVDCVFTAFEESGLYFKGKKLMVVGNPVRDDLITPPPEDNELRMEKLNTDYPTLFVFGGSQGARAINRAVVDFMRSNPTLRDHLNLIHQTGQADMEDTQRQYKEMGYNAIVVPFIHRMSEAYQAADLVVARAGAGAVFELMAVGKPSVLVPFPQAVGDHQTFNAMALASRGAAVMVRQAEIEGGALSRTLKDLLSNTEKLREMGEKARSLARMDAADIIARKLNEMAENKGKALCKEPTEIDG